MWNLLPPETKQEVDKEYHLRFFAICLLLLSFTMVINIIVSLPFALSAHSTAVSVDRKIQDFVKTDIGTTTSPAMEAFNLFNQELGLLAPTASSADRRFTVLIKAIIADKPEGVKISSFSDSTNEKGKLTIVVSGIADSREDLLAFANNLGSDKRYSKVDLPVSNFSKKTDIEYSIMITILN